MVRGPWSSSAPRSGLVAIVVLGAMHFFNMFVISKIRPGTDQADALGGGEEPIRTAQSPRTTPWTGSWSTNGDDTPPWTSSFPRSSAPFRTWRATSPLKEMAPDAGRWDEEKIFPEEALRQAAALGFGGIYLPRRRGRRRALALDAAVIFEELAAGCTSTAAYISIHNMAAWMIDRFGERRAAPGLPAAAHDHGALRQLLPDRAGRRLGCRRRSRPGPSATARTTAQRHQGLHLRRRAERYLCGHVPHRRGGAQGHLDPGRAQGHAGPLLRQAGDASSAGTASRPPW